MAKKKSKTVSQLAEACAKDLQRLVRMKASDDSGYCECVTCGVIKHYKEMQGGHFIPRGNSATKIVEENIHPQCPGCNAFQMKHGSAQAVYTLYMIDMYGRDEVDRMLATKGKPFKWSRADIAETHRSVREQLIQQKERLGD